MLKKGDLLLLLIILALLVGGMLSSRVFKSVGTHRIAVIEQHNRLIEKIDLDELNDTKRIDVSLNYHEVIIAEKGRIRFEDAACPDKTCIKTGWLANSGDMGVCLPNFTIIKILGENPKVDGVTY